MEELYTCEQVAERYKVAVGTVWGWVRDKKLVAIFTGKEYRIRKSDLLEFEESRLTKKTARDSE